MRKSGTKSPAADVDLWDSEAPKYGAILDVTNDAIVVLDKDLRIESTNAAFQAAWDLPASMLATRPTLEKVIRHPSGHQLLDSEGMEASLAAIDTVRQGKPSAEIRRDDGSIMTYKCLALPDGACALVYSDVTEFVRNMELARTQELRYRHALQAADQSFWEWNLFTDQIRISQRFWLQIHRTDMGPILDFDSFLDLVHAADREFLRVTLWPYGEGEEADMVGATDIFRIVTPDGDPRQFALGFGMSYSASDNSVVLAGLLRDVTESRRMRKDLTSARDTAETASAAKSRFLAAMSHELRTPINGILGMNDLLLDSQLSPEQREYAETVRVSGEALLAIITDILDFSKIEAGRLELEQLDFSLADLIGSVVRLLDPRAQEKNLNIGWRVAMEIPPLLRGDPGRLRQVLMNLLGNAVKFATEGHIVVRAKLLPNDDPNTSKIRVEVEDTGIGIPKAAQGKLFQDFTQVDSSVTRKYGGTGLGLAVTRQLVELMDGTVGVESTVDRGSTFWFEIELPSGSGATEDDAVKPQAQQKKARATTADGNQTPRALLAEDNAINRKLLVAYLGKMGIKADTVENGREAVEAVRDGTYAIVLMDVQMPEMDGYEAAREIRRLPGDRGKVPIIAITAFTGAADIERCIAAGMNDFVSKPIDRARLRKSMEKWFDAKNAKPEPTKPASNIPASPDDKIMDPSVLDGLTESLGTDKTRELVSLYIDDIGSRLIRLMKACEDQNFPVLRKEAHDLRSNSGSLGLTRLFALGEGIENACTDGRDDDASRICRDVPDACAKTIAALRSYL